jgi:hypothetical protein
VLKFEDESDNKNDDDDNNNNDDDDDDDAEFSGMFTQLKSVFKININVETSNPWICVTTNAELIIAQ